MSQTNFETARKMMVDCQIRPSKVTNENVLDAFLTVPREAFVGKSQRAIAYVDEDLPLPGGRNLMEPMILARLVQALEVRPEIVFWLLALQQVMVVRSWHAFQVQ